MIEKEGLQFGGVTLTAEAIGKVLFCSVPLDILFLTSPPSFDRLNPGEFLLLVVITSILSVSGLFTDSLLSTIDKVRRLADPASHPRASWVGLALLILFGLADVLFRMLGSPPFIGVLWGVVGALTFFGLLKERKKILAEDAKDKGSLKLPSELRPDVVFFLELLPFGAARALAFLGVVSLAAHPGASLISYVPYLLVSLLLFAALLSRDDLKRVGRQEGRIGRSFD